MANIKRSSIVGFHNIKNKVSRNAFDLSHRHMFTAQIGELLPVFVQWCNPNETFKLGYNGFSRTQPLQTAAFTRLKENIQYYFVPFQSLWKYFEQQVNNMTTGQSGENISRIASSAFQNSPISTGMPYINYTWFLTQMTLLLDEETNKLVSAYNNGAHTLTDLASSVVNEYGSLPHVSFSKLLNSLGYGNFPMETYDIISSFFQYVSQTKSVTVQGFKDSKYGWIGVFNYFDVQNSPNLSIFPLLAYHKIVNDHYLYRQWQSYDARVCNIDYLLPSDSMNFVAKLGNTAYNLKLFQLQYSNLALDYFNGVLPKAQYGEESAASVDISSLSGSAHISGTTTSPTYSNGTSLASPNTSGTLTSDAGTVRSGSVAVSIQTPHTHNISSNASVTISGDGSLKISALRSAIALQKYKEIQESNDSDFASQVLAHFGVKPKREDYKSYFIGGGDSVLDINPQVNQNLADDNQADIKATAAGQLSCGCKFTSDTYGIIIGIYRCVPQLDLAHVGIDRNLFKTDASDFPIPELDNIGMQTQYRCEVVAPSICVPRSVKNSGTLMDSVDMAATYGYLPRYSELKTSYDRYDGAFKNSLKSWVTGYDDNTLRDWMMPHDFGSSITNYGIDHLLKCKPSICNNIFVDQTAYTSDNDKILVGSVNTCVAIRPFSVYGLPYSK